MIPGLCSSIPYSQAALRCEINAGARADNNAADARISHDRRLPVKR